MTISPAIIELNKVNYTFPGGNPVLKEMDFTLQQGQRVP